MMSFELLLSFLLTTLLFAYIPGPAMLYSAAQTLAHGKAAGLMAAYGIFLGGCVHILIAAVGLTAIFHIFPLIYAVLKFAGACWLLYLGIQLIRNARNTKASPLLASTGDLKTKSLKESILVEVLNPKTAIFYVAFLPQFVVSSASLPIWAQLLILGVAVNMIFVSADIVCVYMASWLLQRIKSTPSLQRLLSYISASVFISLGLWVIKRPD
ncbi:LysE family translocator [Acinetobacter larvae]|uniref:Amino acid transporter n=1 Tax=Acinetobacter larvae TaxID=1789224 RepID=A0A1B2M3C2_9GAMM|nr:LysE family translocator [Acinetobacter larvae]AOA59698.1 amino acid transporter [Acinetobacter larvae]